MRQVFIFCPPDEILTLPSLVFRHIMLFFDSNLKFQQKQLIWVKFNRKLGKIQVADGQGLSQIIFLPSSYQILTKFLLKFTLVEDGGNL